MVYQIRFTKEAKKDVAQLTQKQKEKLKKIIQEIISISPYSGKKLLIVVKNSSEILVDSTLYV
ncbi:type II toxin-antitoxin system RelE family toxin [Cyanobacterium sp. DS4]|uniref:type II toxin-antitoxin system RelE family toxin n=1 Tax=Cyanobacterium sp. DS4 TaxID=2878255 RepID=UPI003CD0D60D|nr:toxin of toxin-antitoxin system [Cyanobacterium sp. Dongsha4]